MPLIQLTQGKVAKVCECHYDLVKDRQWYAARSRHKFYAQCMDNRKIVKMHRLITNTPKGMVVDHRDSDGLNNYCSNLRICTDRQNQHNSTKLRPSNKSGYKGVSWRADMNKWRVTVFRGKKIYLGYFTDKIAAAKAYNDYIIKIDGEFAALNRIGE